MRATKPFVRIDEDIFLDAKIRALLKEGGYEYFGIYIGILTVIRRYSDQLYRIPFDDVADLAEWDFHIGKEKLEEVIGCCIDIGLLDSNEDSFWSKRRSNDLMAQTAKLDAQRKAARETNARRKKMKEEVPPAIPFEA